MKTKKCYLLFCVAWAAGFICLLYHTFTQDVELIPTLQAYAIFLIAHSNFSNFGYVVSSSKSGNEWKRINLAFGYNKTQALIYFPFLLRQMPMLFQYLMMHPL